MWFKFELLSAICAVLFGSCPLYARVPSDTQEELAAHLQKAQEYLRNKQPNLAIPELQAAVVIDPENAETQGNLGVLLFFQGAYSDAVPHLRFALEKQPDLTKIQGLLGIAEAKTSDSTDAIRDLNAAFPAITDNKFKTQVGLELVGLYTGLSELEQAAATIAQLRKSDPSNPEVLYAAYRTYADLSSESMLALALAAPDSAQMHQLLAHEEIKEGNTNGAIAQYRQAMAIDPRLPGVHLELAELLNSSSSPAIRSQAVGEYNAALQSDPLNEKAQRRLAEIDAAAGDNTKAVEEFTRAIQLQPSDADAKLGLAKSYVDMGEPDKALPLLEEAIRLEPTDAYAHYRLAMLYRQKKKTDAFKHEIEVYQKLKEAKEKLRATYKDLLIKPTEIRSDGPAPD